MVLVGLKEAGNKLGPEPERLGWRGFREVVTGSELQNGKVTRRDIIQI